MGLYRYKSLASNFQWSLFTISLAALSWAIASLVAPALAEESVSQTQSASVNINTSDPATHVFSQKCSGCHTVGRGNMVGPDLTIVADWTSSELEANVKRMEKFVGALNEDDVKSLVQLLKDPQVKDRLKAEEQRAAAPQAVWEPSSADAGHGLFCGTERFKNGGLACISCHRVQGTGGTMGKDLTDVAQTLGEAALASACEQPNYPVMKAIYSNHPVTRQEALHLTRYFVSLKEVRQSQSDPPVGTIGFAGAAVLLGGIAFFYRNRNTPVRMRLKRR